ncbi:hypothetical protein J7I98_14465 [Streptomyces sp. ISL-98]|uniref:TRADD-N-associated membrane domain-containing protein n=1 Tax=Streptomyces sp. ISL-98 TaxID=2819192 RepID=UPI001BE81617|nr:hypothetical protein [Streptomyces sp. ISL-98]MBT2507069.1 hypothetical protein [Streptomyces sp. ISL-98]
MPEAVADNGEGPVPQAQPDQEQELEDEELDSDFPYNLASEDRGASTTDFLSEDVSAIYHPLIDAERSYYLRDLQARHDPEVQKHIAMLRFAILLLITVTVIGLGISITLATYQRWIAASVVGGVTILLAIILGFAVIHFRSKVASTQVRKLEELTQKFEEIARKAPEDETRGQTAEQKRRAKDQREFYQGLIDTYHAITKKHAARSFRSSQMAMGIGFGLLVTGATVTVFQHDITAQVTLGSLTALGSAFSAYLGATFISAHNEALAQMNYYFGQPLISTYLLEAERMTETIEKPKKDVVMTQVVEAALDEAAIAGQVLQPSAINGGLRRPLRRRRTQQSVQSTERADETS